MVKNQRLAGATRTCSGRKLAPASFAGERDEQLTLSCSRKQQSMLLLLMLLLLLSILLSLLNKQWRYLLDKLQLKKPLPLKKLFQLLLEKLLLDKLPLLQLLSTFPIHTLPLLLLPLLPLFLLPPSLLPSPLPSHPPAYRNLQ